MPTKQMPTRQQLVELSEQLKSRLLSSGQRNRKGNISADLRQELIGALEQLSELAKDEPIAGPATENESDSATSSPEPANTPAKETAEDSHAKTFGNLHELVASAIQVSLDRFQQPIAESIVKTLANQAHSVDADKLRELIGELQSELSDVRFQLQAANSQLAEYQTELKFYHEQSEREDAHAFDFDSPAMSHGSNPLDAPHSPSSRTNEEVEQFDELRRQLEAALSELAVLREQNSDLASKIAHQLTQSATSDKQTGRGSGEQLSWEQRKLLILQQLEDDTDLGSELVPHDEKLSIREVLDSTQAELTRRDQEIEELREIVRLQSEARDGVAIGAAGVAQLLDCDELIQQERQKLREIQEEWESKLRQAEIDLSMERAKIARDRIALEKQMEELKQATPIAVSANGKEKSRERRWLNILGLGEQSSDQSKD